MVHSTTHDEKYSLSAVKILGLICITVPSVVLIAWLFDISMIKGVAQGLATMKFNTALCFLLTGLVICFSRDAKRLRWPRILAPISATVVLFIASLTLVEHLLGLNFGIDQLFVMDAGGGPARFAGRMSMATALCFILIAVAQLSHCTKRSRSWLYTQGLSLLVILMMLLALVGYILGPTSLYKFSWFRSVAVHTALLFLCAGGAMLLLNKDRGIVAPLASPLSGGRHARVMLPMAILLPIVTGWALLQTVVYGWLDHVMAINIFVILYVTVIAVVVWLNASQENRNQESLEKQNRLLAESDAKNALLAAIVTSSNDAILCVDKDNRVVVWNRGAEAVFDLKQEQALHQPVNDVLSPAVLDFDWFHAVSSGESIEPFEVSLANENGKYSEISVSITAVLDTNKDVIGVSLIARDVTYIHQIESDRDEAMRGLVDFKDALDQHAIVAITDARGRITYVNDKFCEIAKYSREELIGRDHRIINSGYHSREFFENLWGTISKGKVWHGEVRNRAKDGEYYWVDTTIVPFLDDDGKPRQYIAIRADVTERIRSAIVLQRQAEELARSNSDLEQFAYIASHDLQEPLRGIDGCVQLLAGRYREQLDARGQEFIDHVVGNVSRMQKLIRDLLAYSRVGTRVKEFMSIQLADVIEDSRLNLASAIADSGAQITIDELPEIFGDRTQLGQVFQNLLSNAIKFSGNQPKIHISAQRHDAIWEVLVADNGIGIDAGYFDRIFVIFQRLHNRDEYSGTGIGLALCKRIMERHGGRIWVDSVPGKGSTFHLTFPISGPTRACLNLENASLNR